MSKLSQFVSPSRIAVPRKINGVEFDGTGDITVEDATKLPLSGGTLTGPISFDGAQTWPTFNQSTAGNAATATKLATARTINGVAFDGTADITVADGTKEPAFAAGTAAQYRRGDKTWQTLDKSAVGLASVDDTSDLAKPISTAVQTALSSKSDTGHAHGAASNAVAGFMSAADKSKLDSIAAGATAYSHPATHPASVIDQDANNRFVSDAEKSAWNGKQATLVSGSNIKSVNGTSMLGSGNVVTGDVTLSGVQTLTNKTLNSPVFNDGYTEGVFAVTGTAPVLSPANGSIQTWALSGNSTPTAGSWASGQSITLLVDDGSAYTINWASMSITWKTGGGTAPALLTAGYTSIELAKIGTTIYGWLAGDA